MSKAKRGRYTKEVDTAVQKQLKKKKSKYVVAYHPGKKGKFRALGGASSMPKAEKIAFAHGVPGIYVIVEVSTDRFAIATLTKYGVWK